MYFAYTCMFICLVSSTREHFLNGLWVVDEMGNVLVYLLGHIWVFYVLNVCIYICHYEEVWRLTFPLKKLKGCRHNGGTYKKALSQMSDDGSSYVRLIRAVASRPVQKLTWEATSNGPKKNVLASGCEVCLSYCSE